jgi:hypothetical protein
LRYIYVLWAVVIAIWVLLAVRSEDPGAKWVYAAAAILFAVSGLLSWWDRRKRDARKPEVVDRHHSSEG